MGRDLGILQKREQLDVLKRGGELLREAFVEVLEPGGQMDFDLPIRQEIIPPRTKPGNEKAILPSS